MVQHQAALLVCILLVALQQCSALLQGQLGQPQLLEYDGPLEGGHRHSCVDLLVHYAQATSCLPFPAPSNWTGPNITAEICLLASGARMVSINTPRNLNAVFHAYLQGPQITVPHITQCATVNRNDTDRTGQEHQSPQTAHQFMLTDLLPGQYLLTVRLVVYNFTYGRHLVIPNDHEQPLWQVPLTIPLLGHPTYSTDNVKSWPICSTAFLHGTILSNMTTDQQLYPDQGKNISAWRGLLRWQPQGCNLVALATIPVEKCLQDRLVCFIGDSHMRHLHNGLTDAAYGLGTRNVTLAKKQSDGHKNAWYAGDSFLDATALASKKRLENCTDIFANTGAWPLSALVPARWTLGHYARDVGRGLQYIRSAAPHARLHWVTVVSHPWIHNNHSRHPPYLNLFKQAGVSLAQAAGYKIINAWDITDPLYTTSYDASHHHHIGAAGYALNEYILNVLCTQWEAHQGRPGRPRK